MRPIKRADEVVGLPPAVALLHHFVNTDDQRQFTAHGTRLRPHDALSTPDALRRWLSDHDLPGGEDVGDADLAHVRAVRTALRDAIEGAVDVDELLSVGLQVRLTHRGAEIGCDTVAPPIGAALASISTAAVITTMSGEWRRLRMCPAPDCHWVFYDRSRPGRARWCSPQLCGNRAKTQRYQQRKRAGSPATPRASASIRSD